MKKVKKKEGFSVFLANYLVKYIVALVQAMKYINYLNLIGGNLNEQS